MSDKKQFRSEEARKNYEKHEKQRAQAAKRKARRNKADTAVSGAKAWLQRNPVKALSAAVAIIAVIVAVVLCVNALTDPLKGRQDNWLITDTSASSTEHRYEHLANFVLPAGYTLDDYSLYKDDMQQDFYCVAEDESATVQNVYVTGAKGVSAADYPASVLSYGFHKTAGEPRTLTINGQTCSALYLVSDESEYYGEGNAIAHMSFYFDAGNACVSATLRSGIIPYEQVPDEATMLAEAEKLLAGLTLVK